MSGQEGEICIELRRLFVIIARSDLRNIDGFRIDDAGNEKHLGMTLKFIEAVDDPATGTL